MKLTPTLPNAQPPAQPPKRRAVAAVNATRQTRDAADQPGRRPSVKPLVDESRTSRLEARIEAVVTPHRGQSPYVNRALTTYAQVAGDGERRSLHDVLGFDEYA